MVGAAGFEPTTPCPPEEGFIVFDNGRIPTFCMNVANCLDSI